MHTCRKKCTGSRILYCILDKRNVSLSKSIMIIQNLASFTDFSLIAELMMLGVFIKYIQQLYVHGLENIYNSSDIFFLAK
jgi:hypothetical protein